MFMRLTLLIAALTAFLSTTAQAAPMRWEFGENFYLGDSPGEAVTIGGFLLSGGFIYDADTGLFSDISISLTDAFNPSSSPITSLQFGIGARRGFSFFDFIDCPETIGGPPCIGGIALQVSTFGGVDLPTEPGTAIVSAGFNFYGADDRPGIAVALPGFNGSGTITASAIPLPAGLALAVTGLAALLGLGHAARIRRRS